MKKFMRLAAAFGLCALSTAALADEVDFYQFRTKHSPEANRSAKFKLEVLETNAIDSSKDNLEKYTCVVRPSAPSKFSCKVRGVALSLEANEASARAVLAASNGVKSEEVLEVKTKEQGVYQMLLKNDRIFHVVMKAPVVADDSMECEVGVVADKKTAMFRCRSEFYPENAFMVRDLPVVRAETGFVALGAENCGQYCNAEDWKTKNAATLSKVSEVILGMQAFKKTVLVDKLDNVYNISLYVRSNSTLPLAINEHYSSGYYRNYYERTDLAGVVMRGELQHIHRGLEGRRGD